MGVRYSLIIKKHKPIIHSHFAYLFDKEFHFSFNILISYNFSFRAHAVFV